MSGGACERAAKSERGWYKWGVSCERGSAVAGAEMYMKDARASTCPRPSGRGGGRREGKIAQGWLQRWMP